MKLGMYHCVQNIHGWTVSHDFCLHQIGVFHVMPEVQALFKTGLYIYTLTHEKWIQQSQVPMLMILQQL